MTTSPIIDQLAADLVPVSPGATRHRVLSAVLAGGVLSFAAMAIRFGIQPNLGDMSHGAPFMMKSAYGVTVAAIAFGLSVAFARPTGTGRLRWVAIILPVAVLGLLALVQLSETPSADWQGLLLGASWRQCPLRILLLAAPIFAGLCGAIRQEAPTRLRAAGAAAGLLAGGVSATIYALACPEASAVFVLVWYSLGISVSAALGALLGPIVLRW